MPIKSHQTSHLPFSGGWRYYNSIKKKAMEQEFSWSGLVLSLSIAFFVILAAAFTMNWLHSNLVYNDFGPGQTIYHLEYISDNYLQLEDFDKLRLEAVSCLV